MLGRDRERERERESKNKCRNPAYFIGKVLGT
jgi:hypothetical protein